MFYISESSLASHTLSLKVQRRLGLLCCYCASWLSYSNVYRIIHCGLFCSKKVQNILAIKDYTTTWNSSAQFQNVWISFEKIHLSKLTGKACSLAWVWSSNFFPFIVNHPVDDGIPRSPLKSCVKILFDIWE